MKVRLRKGQKGLSLIEVTIMLMVLMLLTSVLAPSIWDFIQDAQWVKVKEDCEALAISVTRLVKDVGPRLYTQAGGGLAAYPASKVDIIYSDGTPPEINVAPASNAFGPLSNWWGNNGAGFNPAKMSSCSDQLITNTDSFAGGAQLYPEPGFPNPPVFGLAFGQGWRGAYLSPPCAADPWGHTYQVNTKFLNTTFDAVPSNINHCYDVFCISAGKDGIITTPFGPAVHPGNGGTHRRGDDWVTVIAPCDP